MLPEFHTISLPDGSSYEQPTGLFINNKFVPSVKGLTLKSINPGTDEAIAEIYRATKEDVDIAVKTAKAAFKSWKHFPTSDRAKLLNKLADLVESKRDFLAGIEAQDSGKPKNTNAAYDIDDVIGCFRYYAGWADKIHGQTIPIDKTHFTYTVHEPVGVAAQIIPWNYPLDMLAWKVAPAVAAGNCVVLKSSELTPLSALVFAQLVVEAGFPPGVVNILTGTGIETGEPLCSHPLVNKVAFTGSTAVGKLIQGYAAKNLVPVSMETGGKSPMIVYADADLDKAVNWAAEGIFYNSGQVCSATSRILVEAKVHDTFVAKFKEYTEKSYKCGTQFHDEDVDSEVHVIGPQVSKQQQTKILSYIAGSKEQGAKVATGGGPPSGTKFAKGFYVEPTILDAVTPDMTVFNEEIFGPVVTITTFQTDSEAVDLANKSDYGLAAAIFTQNVTKAHKTASDLDAGTIWINSSNYCDFKIPFGGYKQSGFGRELGEYGLELYTQVKSITMTLE